MALLIEQAKNIHGHFLRAFWVRNRIGKLVAIGAVPSGQSLGFVVMQAKRYERDSSLVQAVARATGLEVRLHRWDNRKGCSKVVAFRRRAR